MVGLGKLAFNCRNIICQAHTPYTSTSPLPHTYFITYLSSPPTPSHSSPKPPTSLPLPHCKHLLPVDNDNFSIHPPNRTKYDGNICSIVTRYRTLRFIAVFFLNQNVGISYISKLGNLWIIMSFAGWYDMYKLIKYIE